jgi:hypothetical protein
MHAASRPSGKFRSNKQQSCTACFDADGKLSQKASTNSWHL